MRNKKRTITIFIASPNDVKDERESVEIVIRELERSFSSESDIRLECIKWETHAAPGMGDPGTVVLNQMDPKSWDIFVGIIWKRFGTTNEEIPSKNGIMFNSGTEREFYCAYDSWKKDKNPQILFYRCIRPPKNIKEVDSSQLNKVEEFFNQFNNGKEHPGFYSEFDSRVEFERKVREDLRKIINRISSKQPFKLGPELNFGHTNQGFLKLFLPSHSEERNIAKKNSLSQAKEMRLIAHSGHAFIGSHGHKFRDIIIENLKKGIKFSLLLSNPWSHIGLFLALGENTSDFSKDSIFDNGSVCIDNADEVICNSSWFKFKVENAFKGYDGLKQEFGDYIEIKLTKYEMPASILITESHCFFEPYLSINLLERYNKGLLTYEIQADNKSHIYVHVKDYFDFLWDISESYENFKKCEEAHKNLFCSNLVKINTKE